MDITGAQLSTTIVVLLAIFGAIITVDKVVDIVKKWRMPSRDVEKMLANDKRRLDEQEEAITELHECTKVTCEGLVALLDHATHDGNTDQLEQAKKNLLKYLMSK